MADNKKRLEVKCNSFAGKFLVPDNDFITQIKNHEIDEELVEKLSKEYSVSKEVIWRKLLDLGKISKELYTSMHEEFSKEVHRSIQKNSNGGNYYNTKKAYLGEGYIADVCKNYYDGRISIYDTAQYLNVKIEAIPQLGIKLKEGNR